MSKEGGLGAFLLTLTPFLFPMCSGAARFEEFLSYSKTRKTRIFFFLHISRVGLEKAGCASDEGRFVGLFDGADISWEIKTYMHAAVCCMMLHASQFQ